MPGDPEEILKSTFGYHAFKPFQWEIIQNVLKKQDTLAILPTGGGKSLCYQIPAMIFPGLTVVVSPLIALMKDQVEQLHEIGVKAVFLNSSLSPEEYQANMKAVRSGEVRLLYVAPETLLSTRLFKLLHTLPLDCLTIDEAHCISEWGHDFRPEYRQIAAVRPHFPQAVCLALTATATPRVRQDIMTCLDLKSADVFVASFNRPNLFIEVQPKLNPFGQLTRFLEDFQAQPGIIYCFTRQQVDSLAADLSSRGIAARPYHAGLADEERKKNQELFIRDDIQIIVATIAFGMGINKSNVRFIVHYDLPKSLEGYYQEIGRAGRDGLPAHCLLLYSYGDAKKLRFFIDQKGEELREASEQHLEAMIRFAEYTGCRRIPLLAYFGEAFSRSDCGMCDHCSGNEQNQTDITIPAQKFLSCVKRTGEQFSARHVIDVLMGKKTAKVIEHEHQNLSTFGIGKELSRKQWQYLARQLVLKGLLTEGGKFGQHRLTPKAYEILKSKEPVMGVLLSEEIKPASRKAPAGEYDHELFEILRIKRKELADEGKVPPYVIFSDRTLVEMATYYPMSEAGMRKISGVGEVKYARYGEIFSDIIRKYCLDHHLDEKPHNGESQSSSLSRPALSSRTVQVGEAFNAGSSLAELAGKWQVSPDTIIQHLVNYALDGHPLRHSGEFLALSRLAPDQQSAVLEAFRILGPERLKPVFEELGGAVSYDELKILRLHFLSSRSS